MKRIIALILALMLLGIQASCLAGSCNAIVKEKNVWLRDKNNSIIDEIPVETKIEVQSYSASLDMFLVKYGNKSGYIKGTGLDITKDNLKKKLNSKQSTSSSSSITLNAQAAYELAQQNYVDYESKNGRLINCKTTYTKGASFNMIYYVFNSKGYNGKTCETQFLLSFNDKKTAYEISPSFKIRFEVPWDSEPNMIVMTINGKSTTIPSSMWRWLYGSIEIDYTEHLDWIRQLVSDGGAFAWSNYIPSSLNGADLSKKTMEYKALKTMWDVWQEAGLDDIFTGNTAKVTAPPTAKPTATPTAKATATPKPTNKPTAKPTAMPKPTNKPTAKPTATPNLFSSNRLTSFTSIWVKGIQDNRYVSSIDDYTKTQSNRALFAAMSWADIVVETGIQFTDSDIKQTIYVAKINNKLCAAFATGNDYIVFVYTYSPLTTKYGIAKNTSSVQMKQLFEKEGAKVWTVSRVDFLDGVQQVTDTIQ